MKVGRESAIIIFLIASLGIIVYAGALSNGFISEDELVVSSNSFITSLANIPYVFSSAYFYLSGEMSYRPVVTLSYFLDYFIWKTNPFGYHLTNLLLHIINVILLYFIVEILSKNRIAAMITALLFVCHPAHAQAVNAIGFREDILASVLFMLAFFLYIKNDRPVYTAGSIIAFFAGMLAKETVLVLPLLFLLYDSQFNSIKSITSLNHPQVKRYAGFAFAGLAYCLLRFYVFYNPMEDIVSYPGGNIVLTLLTIFKIVLFYLKLLILPYNLSAEYVFLPATGLDISVLGSILLVLIILFLLIKIKSYSKILSFAGLWFFIALIPVYNLVPLSNIVAERFLYLPSSGFFIFIAVLFTSLAEPRVIKPFTASLLKLLVPILFLIVFAYSIITIFQNRTWKNNITLWSNAVISSPKSAKAHYNLGNSYCRNQYYDRASIEFEKAIELQPDYSFAYSGLGLIYYNFGNYDEAIRQYSNAIRMDRGNLSAYYNLGLAYYQKGLPAKAMEVFVRGLKVDPDFEEFYKGISMVKKAYGKK